MPPIQKAGVIIAAAIAGAGIHVGASAINRKNNIINSVEPGTFGGKSSDICKGINKLIDQSDHSPIKYLILSIEILNHVCLFLVFNLVIQLFFKFYINENKVKLNISGFIGNSLNEKFNYYYLIIIKLNKQMSHFYIWILLIIFIISLYFSGLYSVELYNNLDDYINIYINDKT